MSNSETERRRDRSNVRQIAVIKQLEYIAREGGFGALVVATDQGLKVAETPPAADAEQLAMLGGLLLDLQTLARRHQTLGEIPEIRLRRKDNSCIVCRLFDYEGTGMALLVVAPAVEGVDETLLERTVTGVQRILSEMQVLNQKQA